MVVVGGGAPGEGEGTVERTLWMNEQTGLVACSQHFGNYATFELDRDPGRDELETPLGTWLRVTSGDAFAFRDATGSDMKCETCAFVPFLRPARPRMTRREWDALPGDYKIDRPGETWALMGTEDGGTALVRVEVVR